MPRYTEKQIENVLREMKGMKFLAAQRLGCDHMTIQRRIEQSPHLQAVLAEETGKLVDLGELKLHSKVQEGDVAAIKYLLSSKGKDRGYGEAAELRLTGSADVEHRHSFGFPDLAALFAAGVRAQLPSPDPDRIIESLDTAHADREAGILPDPPR